MIGRPSFVTFAERALHLRLTRGQRVLARVAFDDVEPRDLDPAEREIARLLFGDVDTIPPAARRILALRLGRGSGKTTLCAAYALWTMCFADVTSCGPGDVPHVVVIAPRRQTAQLAVRMALEMAKGAPDIADMIESESADGFTLRRDDGRRVALAAFAASRGGASARGLSILLFLLDEAEFFLSDGDGAYVVNDRDVYRALIPRLMRGGKGVLISTPWPVRTLMGELFDRNHGAPATALAARATTLTMRDDDPDLAATIATERERDAENASREFDCVAETSGGGSFFDLGAIERAVSDACVLDREIARGATIHAGADFGFRSDSSALAVVERLSDAYALLALDERRPSKGQPLKPSEVIGTFGAVAKRTGARVVAVDGHYLESVREHLNEHGLALEEAPGGQDGKAETYLALRHVLHAGQLTLPRHGRLLAQFRGITSKPTPGGGLSITSPRRAGAGHGDLVSALVLAVWSGSAPPMRIPSVHRPREPPLRAANAGFWGSARGFG